MRRHKSTFTFSFEESKYLCRQAQCGLFPLFLQLPQVEQWRADHNEAADGQGRQKDQVRSSHGHREHGGRLAEAQGAGHKIHSNLER